MTRGDDEVGPLHQAVVVHPVVVHQGASRRLGDTDALEPVDVGLRAQLPADIREEIDRSTQDIGAAATGAVNFNTINAQTAGNVELRGVTDTTLTNVDAANGTILAKSNGSGSCLALPSAKSRISLRFACALIAAFISCSRKSSFCSK